MTTPLEQAALDFAATQGWSKPVPPPVAVPLFDGRATAMTALASHETTAGNIGTLVQVQTPKLWDALAFLNDDIALVADPHYGKVYRVKVGLGSHNPYYTPTDGRSSELSKIRAISLGQWDWYGNAYRIVAPWTQPDWCVLDQFGYPSLWSPPLSVHAEGGNFTLAQYAGLLTKQPNGSYRGTEVVSTPITPLALDTWVEIIVGVKWATDATGSIKCYHRAPGGTWTLAVSKDAIPTEQYGTTPSGTASADFHDMPTVTDHGGLYFGYWNAPPLPSPFPTNTVLRAGITRWASLADVKASFG